MATEDRETGVFRLPSISHLLEHPSVREALQRLPRAVVVDGLREEIAALRAHRNSRSVPPDETIVQRALDRAGRSQQLSLRRAINATGVVLHTGLGRAVLAAAARQAIADVAAGHSVLEIDTATGQRGSRQDHVRGLLCELTGAESALVVNNNAGATFLAVTALAAGREVILSRGELVEIGGSFRMPDIVRASGAALVEVGTTNRTRLSDFEAAITERTGLLLRCHPSNFKIVGFTEETAAADLARLGRERGILVMDDLGSGALLDLEAVGGVPTTTLRAAVATGCDVVTASGDKLLGGPQAGLILGRREVVERIARHPLARALRVDKLTLAALEATLKLYRDPVEARSAIPTLCYLSRSAAVLEEMAARLRTQIEAAVADRCRIDLVAEVSRSGGGSLPGEDLPTTCVRVRPVDPEVSVDAFAARLRANRPAVFARVKGDTLLLDPRTLDESEFAEVVEAVRRASEPVDGRDGCE